MAVNHDLQSSAIIRVWHDEVHVSDEHVDSDSAACLTTDAGCRADLSSPRPQLHFGGHWSQVEGHTGNCAQKGAKVGEVHGARSCGTGAVATLSNATLVKSREPCQPQDLLET